MKLKPLFLTMSIMTVALAMGIGVQYWWAHQHTTPASFHGTVLDHPRPLPVFKLEGTADRRIDNQYLQGHWTFIFFGFSHCGSVCPVTMAELAKLYRLLGQSGNLPMPEVIMITLDPQRDSLKRMQEYVQAFEPHFIGARGSEHDIKHLAHDLGIAFTKLPTANAQANNNIEHSGAVMLINPHGQLTAFFTPPHQAAFIAEDYRLLNTK